MVSFTECLFLDYVSYSCQISQKERFAKIVGDFQLLTIFPKDYIQIFQRLLNTPLKSARKIVSCFDVFIDVCFSLKGRLSRSIPFSEVKQIYDEFCGIRLQDGEVPPELKFAQLWLNESEAAARRCSSKQVFLKFSQYSQEKICVGVSF